MQEGKKYLLSVGSWNIFFWKVVNDRDKFDVYLWKPLASGAINLKINGELALKILSKNIKLGCNEGRYLTVKSAYLLNLLNKDETSRFLHKRELYVETEERDKMKQT